MLNKAILTSFPVFYFSKYLLAGPDQLYAFGNQRQGTMMEVHTGKLIVFVCKQETQSFLPLNAGSVSRTSCLGQNCNLHEQILRAAPGGRTGHLPFVRRKQ